MNKYTAIATAIRAELKTGFPHTRFKVRTETHHIHSTITISYIDGPAIKNISYIEEPYRKIEDLSFTVLYERKMSETARLSIMKDLQINEEQYRAKNYENRDFMAVSKMFNYTSYNNEHCDNAAKEDLNETEKSDISAIINDLKVINETGSVSKISFTSYRVYKKNGLVEVRPIMEEKKQVGQYVALTKKAKMYLSKVAV